MLRAVKASIICWIIVVRPACAQIEVAVDFPGGSGAVEAIDNENGVVRLQPADHPGRGWRCWWYVKLAGLTPGRTITLDVGDAPWATPDRATYSTDDGRTWRQSAAGEREGKRIRYELRFDTETALVAWGPPFVPADASTLVRRLAAATDDAEAFILCRTREGRDTPALRVSTAHSDQQRPLIWIQARQHAWESGSSWVCRGFAEWLVSDDAAARRLREQVEIVIVPIMDIDNVHRGAGGKNQTPQDHNRDWSEQPHWRAVAAAQDRIRAAAAEGRLAAFVDLHNPSARDLEPYFYIPPRDILTPEGRANLMTFLSTARQNMTGPLRFKGKAIESGQKYDPQMWQVISKNWVARLGTPAIAVTLETSWNTPQSTTQGYLTIGRELGVTLAEVLADRQKLGER